MNRFYQETHPEFYVITCTYRNRRCNYWRRAAHIDENKRWRYCMSYESFLAQESQDLNLELLLYSLFSFKRLALQCYSTWILSQFQTTSFTKARGLFLSLSVHFIPFHSKYSLDTLDLHRTCQLRTRHHDRLNFWHKI